jgi:Cu(I)/Ag(I) efflux system membrane fusion protein
MSSPGQKKKLNSNMKSDDNKTLITKDSSSQSVVYICPMDKEVISDKPGKCPICGMELVQGHP